MFDLVMFHHSLEHVANPLKTLESARDHLNPDGKLLIRVPLVNPMIEKYGEFWRGFDAPRHYFVPSLRGLQRLLSRAGFQLTDSKFVSDPGDIVITEAYQRGVRMADIAGGLTAFILQRFVSPQYPEGWSNRQRAGPTPPGRADCYFC